MVGAWDEGYDAANSGKAKSDNPYDEMDNDQCGMGHNYFNWEDGWLEAVDDMNSADAAALNSD